MGDVKRSVAFRLSEDLLARVDAARGPVDRTAFVTVALESLLDVWPPQLMTPSGFVERLGSAATVAERMDAAEQAEQAAAESLRADLR